MSEIRLSITPIYIHLGFITFLCLSLFLFFRPVELYMPKFSISASASLEDTLKDMGIISAFSNKANFTGMTEDIELKVSNVWRDFCSLSLS